MGAKVIEFKVVNFKGARVIGKSTTVKEPTTIYDLTINDLQDLMNNKGHYDFLLSLPNKITLNKDTVGWQGDFNPGDTSYTYLSGVLFQPNTAVPDGYDFRDIESCQMAVVSLQDCDDVEGGDLFADASPNLAKARDEQGYTYDSSHGFFEMEYYSEDKFKIPEHQGEKVVLDFYSPCKKV